MSTTAAIAKADNADYLARGGLAVADAFAIHRALHSNTTVVTLSTGVVLQIIPSANGCRSVNVVVDRARPRGWCKFMEQNKAKQERCCSARPQWCNDHARDPAERRWQAHATGVRQRLGHARGQRAVEDLRGDLQRGGRSALPGWRSSAASARSARSRSARSSTAAAGTGTGASPSRFSRSSAPPCAWRG